MDHPCYVNTNRVCQSFGRHLSDSPVQAIFTYRFLPTACNEAVAYLAGTYMTDHPKEESHSYLQILAYSLH